jgi:hypothetical protein
MASVELTKIQSPKLKNKQQSISFCDKLTKKQNEAIVDETMHSV